MTIKETIIEYCREKNVYPPFTRRKIEKAGHNMREFLLGLKTRMEKADDVKTMESKTLNAFFKACQDLI